MPEHSQPPVEGSQPTREQLRAEGKLATLAEVFQAERDEWMAMETEVKLLRVDNERLREAMAEIRTIAAREWAADETNYEWYGDIAGMAEVALGGSQAKGSE